MTLEGSLDISLRTRCGDVDEVAIASSRPVHASRVFHGKTVSDALQMIPRLFTICGTAQSCAAIRACEQALGYRSSASREQLRTCLVRFETVREHMWRILLDWPAFLEEAPQQEGMAEMLALQRALHKALAASNNPFLLAEDVPHGVHDYPKKQLDRLHAFLEESVFGMPLPSWLDIRNPERLTEWAAAGTTVAARMVNHVMESGWSGVGNSTVTPLPAMERAVVDRLLQEQAFIERPSWEGECCETSCLTRVDSPLLTVLTAQYGNGLLVRLTARITELAQIAVNPMPEEDPGKDVPDDGNGMGMGYAEAARGRLLHRVQLDDGKIVSYQILAPTEWNFHPQGVVARSLATLHGDHALIEQQARLLINAIDPCVSYQLSIADA